MLGTGFNHFWHAPTEDHGGDLGEHVLKRPLETALDLLADLVYRPGFAQSEFDRVRQLRANRLRIIDTVLESNTQLVANPTALENPWKRTKLDNIALLLKAAIEAQGRVGIMLNVARERLDGVLALLPALQARPQAGWLHARYSATGCFAAASGLRHPPAA